MTRDELDRRSVLKAAGIVTTGLLAGCTGGSGDADGGGSSSNGSGGSSGGDSGGSSDDSDGSSSDDAGGSSDDSEGSSSGSSPDFGGWFEGVENFDGVADRTGSNEVTVTVGTSANGGNFGFGPAAIRVDAGTTVVWEWNGKGGSHNVVAESGDFESELVGESGHTFSHTFEEAGTVEYACTPHKTVGMKGAVVVE